MRLSTILRPALIVALASSFVVTRALAQVASPVESDRTSPVTQSEGNVNSPETKRLLEEIHTLESEAESVAKAIQQMEGSGQTENKRLPVHQRKLGDLLTAAFDRKLRLEELQVKELQSRLTRFELQIRQRKQFRETIVAHRASQLVDRSKFQWSPTDADAEKQDPMVDPLRAILKRRFPDSAIECYALINGAVLLMGEVADGQTVTHVMDVARVYSPEVINHIRVAAPASGKLEKGALTAHDHQNSSDESEIEPDGSANLDALSSIEKLREQLEPSAKRFAAAVNRVRELETPYFRDRSGVVELQEALKEFIEVRRDFGLRFKELMLAREEIAEVVELLQKSVETRWADITVRLLNGALTEEELKVASDLRARSTKRLFAAKLKIEEFDTAVSKMMPPIVANASLNEEDPSLHVKFLTTHDSGLRLDVAHAWLENQLSVKLELVRCDDLKLWFKTALRVCQSKGELNTGDLIVLLENYSFESWDQAVLALTRRPNIREFTYLKGGLTGQSKTSRTQKSPVQQMLEPSSIGKACIRVEVRVRRDGTNELEPKYLTGVCLSPLGLVVIPVSSKSLVESEGIFAIDQGKLTTRVVASDDAHGLTLIKIDSTQQEQFPWLKCRSQMPVKNQRVKMWCRDYDSDIEGTISDVNQPYPLPFVGSDAFVLTTPRLLEPNTEVSTAVTEGSPLVALDGDVQGIVIERPSGSDKEKANSSRYVGLPALHIEKLLNDYFGSQKK